MSRICEIWLFGVKHEIVESLVRRFETFQKPLTEFLISDS